MSCQEEQDEIGLATHTHTQAAHAHLPAATKPTWYSSAIWGELEAGFHSNPKLGNV